MVIPWRSVGSVCIWPKSPQHAGFSSEMDPLKFLFISGIKLGSIMWISWIYNHSRHWILTIQLVSQLSSADLFIIFFCSQNSLKCVIMEQWPRYRTNWKFMLNKIFLCMCWPGLCSSLWKELEIDWRCE